MTHIFYRKRRELPPKSPLLPLIHAEQSKQEKYAAMLKSGVPPHAVFGITEPSKVVKLPHELEEGYKEYHDRPLYMRLFRNYEEQHEENKNHHKTRPRCCTTRRDTLHAATRFPFYTSCRF